VTSRRLLAALLLLLPLACTTTPDDHPFLQPTGSGGITGGFGGSGGHPNTSMVMVTITSPADGASFGVNSDVVVTASASVQGGPDFIDTSSVTMTLVPVGGMANSANGVLVFTGADTYSGTLSLGSVPAGMYTLTVAAKSSSGMRATSSITITIDAGPIITVLSPVANHGYNGSVAIELTVDAGPSGLSSGPTATIAGMPVPLSPPDANTPDYRAIVVFGPTANPPQGAVVLPALSGKQLFDVQATNGMHVKSEARVTFVIDTAGPTIESTTPVTGDVVGGVVKISATILDDSGVLDSSVVAVISDAETPVFELPLVPQGSGIYSILFDTANLTACPEPPSTALCLVFPTISFRAVDLVGNQTVVSYGFSVDNVAPVADLDPPEVRQEQLTATGYQCSFKFDPLSLNTYAGDMPDDGCPVPQVFDLKARIMDDGNRASDVKETPLSLVDPDNTNVFIMPMTNATQPLVVDANNDGRCDEINPLLLPASPTAPPAVPSGILQVRMAPVPIQGNANFNNVKDLSVPAGPDEEDNCAPGNAPAPPMRLCNQPRIPTIAIGYPTLNAPSIWSVEPIDKTAHCLGDQLDTRANNIPEGWACIAVQTRDRAGNQSVSVPIRVYIQYTYGNQFPPGTPDWCVKSAIPAAAGPPPTCAGTYDPAAKTAAFGSCTSRKVQRTYVEHYCLPGTC
jgi:hypothetical protein